MKIRVLNGQHFFIHFNFVIVILEVVMKKNRLLLLLSVISLPLCGCNDIFEKSVDGSEYAGSYVLNAATEKTYHVAWNVKTLKSEKELMQSCSFVIKADKTVEFTDHDGKVTKGRVKCFEKYVRFIGTPLTRSYEFHKQYDKSLSYSWESKHASAEYDVTYRSIVFKKVA